MNIPAGQPPNLAKIMANEDTAKNFIKPWIIMGIPK